VRAWLMVSPLGFVIEGQRFHGPLIVSVARRLGTSPDEAIVLADDSEQAGLVQTDVPLRMRARRLPVGMHPS
jgi:hypothetical protein